MALKDVKNTFESLFLHSIFQLYLYDFTSAEDEKKCAENGKDGAWIQTSEGSDSTFNEQAILLTMHHAVLKTKYTRNGCLSTYFPDYLLYFLINQTSSLTCCKIVVAEFSCHWFPLS